MTGSQPSSPIASTPGGQTPTQAPHSGPANVMQRCSTSWTRPSRTVGCSGTSSAGVSHAAAHGKPSHIRHARCSGSITGVPVSMPDVSVKIAACGHARTQSPHFVHSAWNCSSSVAPGGLRRRGRCRATSCSTPRATVSMAVGSSPLSHFLLPRSTITCVRSACSCRDASTTSQTPKSVSSSPRRG
jgi:hypothetical protein